METSYVIGHQNPDTDTVVSAIIAADFLNQREGVTMYEPRITAPINSETEFALSHFMVEVPAILEDANGANLVLVDHNEQSQMVAGEKNITHIIDHHKLNFTGSNPIEVTMKPWGSTVTVLLDMYAKENLEVPAHLLGIALAAIVSDTVILRSPTTTPHDTAMVEALADALQVDYTDLGMQLFKAKAQIASKSAADIIHTDFKDLEVNGNKIGIGQIEAPDLAEVTAKIPEIIASLQSIKEFDYHTVILMITDIVAEGSQLVMISDAEQALCAAFNTTITDHVTAFIPGMMSRKKQVVPVITDTLA